MCFLFATVLHCTVQEPLGEYVRLIVSVKNALQQRQDKKADYLASLTDVEAKQIAHNKIALSPAKEDQACIKLVSESYLSITINDPTIASMIQ